MADLSLGEPSTTEYRAPRKKSVADILEAKEGEVDPHVSVRAKEHSNKHTRAVAAAAAAASSRWSRLARPG